MYQRGHGVEKNYEEAVKFYRLAAEQGSIRARKNLFVYRNRVLIRFIIVLGLIYLFFKTRNFL